MPRPPVLDARPPGGMRDVGWSLTLGCHVLGGSQEAAVTARRAPAPKGLGTRGRAFWRRVTSDFELAIDELELLVEVARALDECEALHQVVDEQGRTVTGSRGQVVAHPALAELRQTRIMLGRLLAQLELPDDEGASLPTPLQARGRQANRARWGREVSGRGSA